MTETCQILDYFLKFVPLVNNFTRQRVWKRVRQRARQRVQ